MSSLFDALQIGRLTLPNRVVMAPLTRCRAAQPGDVPTPLMAEYYAQRASAGLIISEATWIEPQAKGYLWTPGIVTAAQRDGWRKVTDAVHAAGGRIICQLWHVGRVSHASVLPEGMVPVSSMATEHDAHTFALDAEGKPGRVRCTPCRALAFEEVLALPRTYALAAGQAIDAGFDGVEIHAANGYLLEQFIRPTSNQRTDSYGGSIENRARFVLEAAKAAIAAIGADKVGIRLSPYGVYNDMPDYPDMASDYAYLAAKLNELGLVYIHLVDHSSMGAPEVSASIKQTIRKEFKRSLILSGGYDAARAEKELEDKACDLVAVGRPFLSNPDLVARWKSGAAVNEIDFGTFYTPGPKGFTDYPKL
jgi:N-ethylmaleimide reductase